MHIEQIHLTTCAPNNQRQKQSLPFQQGYQNLGNIELIAEISPQQSGQRLQLFVSCKEETLFQELSLELPFPRGLDWPAEIQSMFLNGFQSWTDSREFALNEKIPALSPLAHLPKMHRFGDYTFLPATKGKSLHSYTYTYFRALHEEKGEKELTTQNADSPRAPQSKNADNNRSAKAKPIYFLGSLFEQNGYTRFILTNQSTLYIQKELEGHHCGGRQLLLDVWLGQGEETQIFAQYFAYFGLEGNNIPPRTGWTSWYHYYTHISEEILSSNLQAFAERDIPIDIFQIDDGYQTAVGDWLSTDQSKFPHGMAYLAQKIHQHSYLAGLWLAPFICEKNSQIKKEHPDWLLRDSQGKPVPVGWNPLWSGHFYAMDFYNENFRAYLKQVFDTVLEQWGFDMVKLDFLYGVAWLPQHGKSRGQVMYEALAFLRETIGQKMILGCGVPLGPSFGLVDYCRIGSDVSPKWEDRLLSAIHYRERVSTINSLTSTIGRHHLNGYAFGNDPDVFILRKQNQKMTWEQRRTLFVLNNIFGSLVFTSDPIAEYDSPTLELYRSMFPLRAKKILQTETENDILTARFRIGEQTYFALSNLSPKEKWLHAPEGWLFSQEHSFVRGGARMRLRPFHTAILLQLPQTQWAIAGSTGHIFPGSEISTFHYNEQKRELTTLHSDAKFQQAATAFIKVPDGQDILYYGGKLKPKQVWNELFILEVPIQPDPPKASSS